MGKIRKLDDLLLTPKSGLTPRGSVLENWVVDTGQTIQEGDLVEFVGGKARVAADRRGWGGKFGTLYVYDSIAASMVLPAGRFLLVGEAQSSPYYITAVAGSVLGTGTSMGVSATVAAEVPSGSGFICCPLNTGKTLVCWSGPGATAWGRCAVVTVNADLSLTMGPTYTFTTTATVYDIDCVPMGTDKSMIAWNDSNGYCRAVIVTASGTALSFGTILDVWATGASSVALARCANDKAVVACGRSTVPNGTVMVLSVSGTTLSVGSGATVVGTTYFQYTSMAELDIDKTILFYTTAAAGGTVVGIVVSVSGTVPSLGSPLTVYTEGGVVQLKPYGAGSPPVPATYAMIAYKDGGGYRGQQGVSVSGTALTLDTVTTPSFTGSSIPSACGVDHGKIVLATHIDGALLCLSKVAEGIAAASGAAGASIPVYRFL